MYRLDWWKNKLLLLLLLLYDWDASAVSSFMPSQITDGANSTCMVYISAYIILRLLSAISHIFLDFFP
jgi:hypothetical protein